MVFLLRFEAAVAEASDAQGARDGLGIDGFLVVPLRQSSNCPSADVTANSARREATGSFVHERPPDLRTSTIRGRRLSDLKRCEHPSGELHMLSMLDTLEAVGNRANA